MDLDSLALDALADAPAEVEKPAEFIEFECSYCNEMVKVGLENAGKRVQCPECRRITQVPIPKNRDKANWRDTGPKLPAGARRDEGPAPEGAWGTGKATGISHETAQEAGLIKEPEKPLTFYQRYQRVMMIGFPILLLGGAAFGVWQWMSANQEKRALDLAVSTAASDTGRKALGAEGLAALYGGVATYHLNSQTPGCATSAKENFGKAVALGASARQASKDLLLGEIALAELYAGAEQDQTEGERKLLWKEVHKLLRSTLAGIGEHRARLMALRSVTAGLSERGQADHVLPLVAQIYPGTGVARADALAIVGMELHRLGNKKLAEQAMSEIKPIFAEKKPPAPPAAVVAFHIVMDQEPPKFDKPDLVEAEAIAVGRAEGLARAGKLDQARNITEGMPREGGGKLRGLIALATGATEAKQGDASDLDAALDFVKQTERRPDLVWPLVRLVQTGTSAGAAPDKLEAAADAITDDSLRAWGRLLIVRMRLRASQGVEPVAAVEVVPAKSAAGLVARMELARHNTRQSAGWASTVKEWDEAPRALGSLGVALGMQGSK